MGFQGLLLYSSAVIKKQVYSFMETFAREMRERMPARSLAGRRITLLVLLNLGAVVGVWNIIDSTSPVQRVLSLWAVFLAGASFARAAFGDPGRLRARKTAGRDETLRLSDGTQIITQSFVGRRDVLVAGQVHRLRLCDTCLIFRPRGAAHCTDCGHCLLEKDHHCFWLSNCIGRNNLRVFTVFILSLAVLFGLAGRAASFLLGHWRPSLLTGAVVSSLYAFSGLLFLFLLYYAYLGAANLTSRECIGGVRPHPLPPADTLRRLLTLRPAVVFRQESV